ncbi:hypothetical protein LSAT2_000708 [Lamellibrachia satsuma]|nr:hypothetical protein LSAT2_000708 [Lamellibrachia satsuma]
MGNHWPASGRSRRQFNAGTASARFVAGVRVLNIDCQDSGGVNGLGHGRLLRLCRKATLERSLDTDHIVATGDAVARSSLLKPLAGARAASLKRRFSLRETL